MGPTLIALVWALNFALSVWNAYAVDKVWVEARAAGGWRRLACWVGAVMSACGFTWCYLSFPAVAAHHFGWLSDEPARSDPVLRVFPRRQRSWPRRQPPNRLDR